MALSAACKVYIAFADGPLIASPTWTEVTAYVRNVSISRGRSSELDDFQAGSATIVLGNRDRRFDPDYTSGPYYPNLLPRRQVKVEAVYSGVTYAVFRGVTQSFEQGYPAVGRDATCTLRCTDLLTLFATWDLPRDAHASVIEPLAPTLWWSLGDDVTALDNAGRYNAVYGEAREAIDPLVPGGDGASRVTITAANTSGVIASRRPTFGSKASYTLSFLMRADADCRLAYLWQTNVLAGNQVATVDIVGGILRYYQGGGAGASETATATGTVPVADGNVHHIACVRSGDTITIYVDGASDATATSAASMLSMDPLVMTIGDISTPGYVEMDEYAVFWDVALTSGQVASLAATRIGWNGDRVGTRLQALCDILGVPAGLVSFGTSSSSLGPFSGDSDAFSVAAQASRSDQGRLFMSKAGVLTFQPKTTDMGASSALTFADDTTANAVRYAGFGLELDERLVYNLVTVSGADDSSFTARDATSQSTYSKRSLAWDTNLPSAAACRDVAQALVSRYAAPATRGRSWNVYPQRTLIGSTTLAWASVLNRELGDIVTLKRSPSTGTAITKTVQVTSIAHEIDLPNGEWTVTFAGAPAYTTASFRWGTSNWDGTEGWS